MNTEADRALRAERQANKWFPWGYRSADHDLDQRITQRRWDVWGDDDRPYPAEPKWFRGELKTIGRRRKL